jgi:hypothetical protein
LINESSYLARLSGKLEFRLSRLLGLLCLLWLLGTLSSSLGLFTSVDPGLLSLGLPVSGLSLGLGSSLAITVCGLSFDLFTTLGRLSSSLYHQLGVLWDIQQTYRCPLLLGLGFTLLADNATLVDGLLALLQVSGSFGSGSSFIPCLSPLGDFILGSGQFQSNSSITECY